MGLVTTQGSSIWPLVCVEFWGSLSIFLKVSQKQLPALGSDRGLLLGTEVQLMVSCTAIET